MICYRLILEPDLESSVSITDHSRPLDFRIEPPPPTTGDGRIKFRQGDKLAVSIEVRGIGERDLSTLSVHSMNLLSCRSPDAPPVQFFNSIFRRDADVPDSRILASGASTFVPLLVDPNSEVLSFEMTIPTRELELVRPGDFTVVFMLSIAEQTDTGIEIIKFIRDPEMCVEPSG